MCFAVARIPSFSLRLGRTAPWRRLNSWFVSRVYAACLNCHNAARNAGSAASSGLA